MYNILNNLQKEQYINLIKNGDLWIMGRIVILCFTFLVISSSLSTYLKIYSVYTQRSSKSIDSFYHVHIRS